MTTAGGHVQLENLEKSFGDVRTLRGISLDIPQGEFYSLLGPSGCGKTTTLRMIAGFERPTSGRILLDGQDVAMTPPHKRNVNTVFQSYALFPHLDVERNVAFGLRFHNVGKEETRERVGRALALVELSGYEGRKPNQLSGGQQQRVALARALILNPAVLLLDEPLGALDAKLRKSLQIELKALQERVGITFIYVTHDQEEALTMSDRIAVMSNGTIEQEGPPREVYEEPETVYVADFLGVSNVMDAEAAGGSRVRIGEFDMTASKGDSGATGRVKLVIRPERVVVHPQGTSGSNHIPAMVERGRLRRTGPTGDPPARSRRAAPGAHHESRGGPPLLPGQPRRGGAAARGVARVEGHRRAAHSDGRRKVRKASVPTPAQTQAS